MSNSDSDDAGAISGKTTNAATSRDGPSSAKRKLEEHEDSGRHLAKAKRLKKSRKKKDGSQSDGRDLDLENGLNNAFAHMDSSLLADYLAQRTKRFRPGLSLAEMDVCAIPEKAITDTSSWRKLRTADHLPTFLEHFATAKRKGKKASLATAPEEKGSPHTLIIAGAGLRAADLTRALRKFQTKDALVAKLFAKHIKMQAATEVVKSNRIGIGVGTPQRIYDLLETGALSSTHLERIVIDTSHINEKKQGILDIKETQIQLVQLLSRMELVGRFGVETGNVNLCFF